MPEAPFDIPRAHRWFAVEFNNLAWDLLEKESLSDEEAELLVDTAHSSVRHWREAGQAINYLRGQVLLTTVYARIGDAPAAVRHAERCLKSAREIGNELSAWDAACAPGCAALAYAASGDTAKADALRAKAIAIAQIFDDPEETQLFRKLFLPE